MIRILSLSPAYPKVRGGHRPYNLDRALASENIEIEIVYNLLPRRGRLADIKILGKEQQENRTQIKKFTKKEGNKYFLLHGIQSNSYIDYLKKTEIPIILDFRDDPIRQFDSTLAYDKTYRKEMPENKRIEAKKYLDYSLANSEKILFPSETLASFYSIDIRAKGIICPNASDPEHFRSSPLPNNQKIGLLTGMQPIAGVETLLDACLLLKKDFDKLEVEIGTSDSPLPGYEEYIQSKFGKYEWITFRKDVFYQNAPDFFVDAYMSVNLMPKTEYFDACTPLKLFDTMASARPIVNTDLIESSKIVHENDCGLVADHNIESIAENIAKLLSDRVLAQKMGQNGRRAIEERHSWKHRAQTIISALE